MDERRVINLKDKATRLIHVLTGQTASTTVMAEPGQWDWRNHGEEEDDNTLYVDKEPPHFQKEEESKIRGTKNY